MNKFVATSMCVSLMVVCGICGVTAASAEDAPLRVVMPNAPRSMDPHIDPTQVGDTVFCNIYETLVDVNLEGQVVGELATQWERLSDTEWWFDLRQGVFFHDGSKLTSEDVAASIMRSRNHPQSESRVLLETVEDARIDGPHAIRVKLNGPDAVFLKKLSQVSIVPRSGPDVIVEPIGTGPYRVISVEDGESMTFKAFAKYWRPNAGVQKVILSFNEDRDDALAQLQSGAVDIVSSIAPESVAEVERNTDLWVDSSIGSLVYFLALNAGEGLMSDPIVREAVDCALDRQQLAKESFLSYARPAGQLVNDSAYGYAPDVGAPSRNLARAKALTAVASLEQEVRFTLEYKAGDEEIASLMLRQLAEAGIKVDLELVQWNELLSRLLAGEVEAALFTWRSDLTDVGFTYDFIVHSASPSAPGTAPATPESDRLIVASRTMLDPELRLGLLHSVTERVAQRRALLPLVWSMDLYGVRRDISWEPNPSGTVVFSKASRR
ncbi:MAG: hypothetical protein GY906_01110 [bacterium]|nr:hypothetical protein [bacterium]